MMEAMSDKPDPLDLRSKQLQAIEELLADLEAADPDDPQRLERLEWARAAVEEWRGYVRRRLERN
jgi:hypothetical protein